MVMTATEFLAIEALRADYIRVSDEWRELREEFSVTNPLVRARFGLLGMIAQDLREDHGIDIDDLL